MQLTCLHYYKQVLVVLSLILLTVSVDGLGGRPRGLRPELITFYDPNASNGMFQCLDGSITIKYLQVNDDYCDCPDGSDEPGTSACSNGKFYCLNKGFKPKILPSSRVNDGICDCCDGSDEWAGPLYQLGDVGSGSSGCANVCREMGKEEREERERLAKVIEEGAKLRNEMIENGHERKKQRASETEVKKAEIDQVKIELELKRLLKEAAEMPEKEALEKIKAEEDRIKQLREEEDKLLRENEAMIIFDNLDTNKDGQITKEELALEIRFDQNNDGMVNDEEAEFYMSGNESYQRDTFIDNGWPLMKPALTEEENNETTETSDPAPEYDGEDEDHVGSDPDDDDDEEEEEEYEDDEVAPHVRQPPEHDDVAAEAPNETTKESKYDEATQLLVDAAEAARKEFGTIDRKHRDLERDITHLEGVIGNDYGPEEEFAALAGQCFEYTDQEYTYKVCAFDYCSQRPNSQGGGETRLGKWEKWEDELYTAQVYENGVQCWNGPQRSTRVVMRCGLRNALVASTEPNRCEYQFIFETPALCKQLDMPLDDGLEQNHEEL